jgi:hypothetical protein
MLAGTYSITKVLLTPLNQKNIRTWEAAKLCWFWEWTYSRYL